MCTIVFNRLQLESRALVQSLEHMHSKTQFPFHQLMAEWKMGKGEKKIASYWSKHTSLAVKKCSICPSFFIPLKMWENPQHLNIYIFSCFFSSWSDSLNSEKVPEKNLKMAPFTKQAFGWSVFFYIPYESLKTSLEKLKCLNNLFILSLLTFHTIHGYRCVLQHI